MNTPRRGCHGDAHRVPAQRLTLTLCCGLAVGVPASAQTVPFEAAQRLRIGDGVGQSSVPQGGTFEPRIDMAVQYAGNLNLAPDGEPQVDLAGLEIAPGFYASQSNGSVLAAIDYSMIGRAWEDSDVNDISHQLAANGRWFAVPEWFAVRGAANYRDSIVDPRRSLPPTMIGIFDLKNVQEVAAANVNPLLQHRFDMLEVAVDYRYGRVWFLDQGKGQEPVDTTAFSDDSIDQSARATIGTAPGAGRVFATAFYDWQTSEYETSRLPYEFERAGLNAGMRIMRNLSIVGDVGRETDLSKRVARGGLDEGFWSVGLRWTPSDRTFAEARYGDRSYGEYYYFNATHRARLLEFTASYIEQPTVQTQRLSLGDIVPGELPPGLPDVDVGVVNNLPFIARDARASVAAAGSRTSLDASVFWYERDYLASQGLEEAGHGASLRASRQLASNLSADLDLVYREYDLGAVVAPALDSLSRDTQATLRLNRRSSEKLTLGAETGYLRRTGDRQFDGWWVALRARYSP